MFFFELSINGNTNATAAVVLSRWPVPRHATMASNRRRSMPEIRLELDEK
jgi:hypothetical protein